MFCTEDADRPSCVCLRVRVRVRCAISRVTALQDGDPSSLNRRQYPTTFQIFIFYKVEVINFTRQLYEKPFALDKVAPYHLTKLAV